MTTLDRAVVIGIFKEARQAQKVVDILLDVGFSKEQIWIAMPAGEPETYSIFEKLVHMGIPEGEANDYKRELEAGNSIVSVRHEGRKWEAINILYDGKVHKFMKRLKDQNEVVQDSLSNISSNKPLSSKAEAPIADERPAWMRILQDAGFDHLI